MVVVSVVIRVVEDDGWVWMAAPCGCAMRTTTEQVGVHLLALMAHAKKQREGAVCTSTRVFVLP